MSNFLSVSITQVVSILLIIVVVRCLISVAIPRPIRTAFYRGIGEANKNISKRYNDYAKSKEKAKVTELKESKLKEVSSKNRDSLNNDDFDLELHDLKREMLLEIEILRTFFEDLPEKYITDKELGVMRNVKKEILSLNIPDIASKKDSNNSREREDNKKVVNIKDKSNAKTKKA